MAREWATQAQQELKTTNQEIKYPILILNQNKRTNKRKEKEKKQHKDFKIILKLALVNAIAKISYDSQQSV